MVAKAMLKYTVKKREDLRIAIEYLEGRMTGDEAIGAFNDEVRIGRRRGNMHDQTLPHTRKEGLRLSKLENAKKARAAYAVNVSLEVQEQILNDHREFKLSMVRLSKKYGYSTHVIRRVLGAP